MEKRPGVEAPLAMTSRLISKGGIGYVAMFPSNLLLSTACRLSFSSFYTRSLCSLVFCPIRIVNVTVSLIL
jgi:hypothetical protein